MELTSCTFSGTENQGFRQLNKHLNAHRENWPSPPLSSGSLPEHLLEPLPAFAQSRALWNFQGMPHLSLLYLAPFPKWMPRFFAYPHFIVADFSFFPLILPLQGCGNLLIFYPLCSLSAILPHHCLLYPFLFKNFYWNIIALQSRTNFCCTAKWTSYMYRYNLSFWILFPFRSPQNIE